VTVPAANINFDFTLVKYKVPKYYQPLGDVLLLKRKRDAETGTAHMTARRLGALFEGICPSTPNLLAAYGEQVSNIVDAAVDSESKDCSNAIFAAYSGIDGRQLGVVTCSCGSSFPMRFWKVCLTHRFRFSFQLALFHVTNISLSLSYPYYRALQESLSCLKSCNQRYTRSNLTQWRN
jgi:hypothetical protein